MKQIHTPQAVQACHELLCWLVPQLDKFPRSRRFTLGERLESGLLKVLESLITATYSREKRTALGEANLRLAICRHLWRMCYELQVIPLKRYEHGARLIDGIGGQIGNWAKSQRV